MSKFSNLFTIAMLVSSLNLFAGLNTQISAGNACLDNQNNSTSAELSNLHTSLNEITEQNFDINQQLTQRQLDSLCAAIEITQSGPTVNGKSYWKYEEMLFEFLGLNINSTDSIDKLKAYLATNYKSITCRNNVLERGSGLLIALASSHGQSILVEFIARYKVDYKNIEDAKGLKLMPWLQQEIEQAPTESVKNVYSRMYNHLTRVDPTVDDDDGFF